MSATVERRRFTVAEFGRLADVGVFRADERLELVDGEVVEMSPIGERHAACVDLLTRRVSRQAGDLAIVRVQGPLAVPDDSELYPDLPSSSAPRQPKNARTWAMTSHPPKNP